EAVGMVKEARAGLQRDRLLAGVDEVPILFALGRCLAEAEHAVLSMKHRLAPGGLELRHHLREADAEVDIGAVGDVLRRAPGDLGVGQLGQQYATPARISASSCCGSGTSTT